MPELSPGLVPEVGPHFRAHLALKSGTKMGPRGGVLHCLVMQSMMLSLSLCALSHGCASARAAGTQICPLQPLKEHSRTHKGALLPNRKSRAAQRNREGHFQAQHQQTAHVSDTTQRAPPGPPLTRHKPKMTNHTKRRESKAGRQASTGC